MKYVVYGAIVALSVLSGCGSVTVPAAVKMSNGEALVGTTTAALSGGTFQVRTATGAVSCSGNYDALDTRPSITAPVLCTDGRYGTITVIRAPDGMGGTGTVTLADGSSGLVAFGRDAGSVLTSSSDTIGDGGVSSPVYASPENSSTTPTSGNYPSSALYSPSYSSSNSNRVYTGNCPTPESLDSAGRRCGARSAAVRLGGYDGYGAWASTGLRSSGPVYVRGYYRKNGTYVRGHTRRR